MVVVVVHVDDLFSIGTKARCDQFGRDLNDHVPIKNLGDLRLYAGIRFSRDRAAGTITLSRETFASNLVKKFGVTRNKGIPMVVGLKLEEFDAAEPDVLETFRSFVGHLMWLANQTRPDILNAVRAVARNSHAPKSVHWYAALHILMYVRSTRSVWGSLMRRWDLGALSWSFSWTRLSLPRPPAGARSLVPL